MAMRPLSTRSIESSSMAGRETPVPGPIPRVRPSPIKRFRECSPGIGVIDPHHHRFDGLSEEETGHFLQTIDCRIQRVPP